MYLTCFLFNTNCHFYDERSREFKIYHAVFISEATIFDITAFHSLFRIFSIILHSLSLSLSPRSFISITAEGFLPRTSVSTKFACTVYLLFAVSTQPPARFICRMRVHASAILRNFVREYEGASGNRASFAADAFEHIPRMTRRMFIRNYPESFPQAAYVDCFGRDRMFKMLGKNFELSILKPYAIFVMIKFTHCWLRI